jgi:hypothetical protein
VDEATHVEAALSADLTRLVLEFSGTGEATTISVPVAQLAGLAATLVRLDRALSDDVAAANTGPEGPGD